MPTVSIDYFFMGPCGQEEAQVVLPMLEVKSHELRSHMLRSGKDLWIRRNGDLLQRSRLLVFKSDQKPAVLALKQAVRESMLAVEFVMEESLVEEHQSNGTIEVTVRETQNKSE